jgi:hypothetical protein
MSYDKVVETMQSAHSGAFYNGLLSEAPPATSLSINKRVTARDPSLTDGPVRGAKSYEVTREGEGKMLVRGETGPMWLRACDLVVTP